MTKLKWNKVQQHKAFWAYCGPFIMEQHGEYNRKMARKVRKAFQAGGETSMFTGPRPTDSDELAKWTAENKPVTTPPIW